MRSRRVKHEVEAGESGVLKNSLRDSKVGDEYQGRIHVSC